MATAFAILVTLGKTVQRSAREALVCIVFTLVFVRTTLFVTMSMGHVHARKVSMEPIVINQEIGRPARNKIALSEMQWI